jgi:hypothetical protein
MGRILIYPDAYASSRRDVMTATDFTTILKDAPIGEWIALSSDERRIIATAKTLESAIRSARELGEKDPVMMKVPPEGALVL